MLPGHDPRVARASQIRRGRFDRIFSWIKTNPKSDPWFFLNHGSQFLWWFFKNVLNLRRKKLRTIETTRDVHTERGLKQHTHTFQIFAIFYLKEEKHEGLMFWMQTRYVSCVFGRSNSTGLTFFPHLNFKMKSRWRSGMPSCSFHLPYGNHWPSGHPWPSQCRSSGQHPDPADPSEQEQGRPAETSSLLRFSGNLPWWIAARDIEKTTSLPHFNVSHVTCECHIYLYRCSLYAAYTWKQYIYIRILYTVYI